MQKKHLNFVVLIDLALKVMTKCLRNIVGSGPTTCQTDTEMFQAENLRKIKKKKKGRNSSMAQAWHPGR